MLILDATLSIVHSPLSQGAMQNGMMNPNVMGNQGSPMMQNMSDGQFMATMPMGDIYGTRMGANGAMQGPGGASGGNHALQDYQMQLMLLEQQNKKRLMMARQEQDNIGRDQSMPGQPGMNPGMSPSGSRTGTSPNPSEQMKRTPQIGGSPAAGDVMQGRGSPGPMAFMGGMSQDFGNPMLMRNGNDGMPGPGGHGMRPGPNLNMEAMARAQQGKNMPGGNWQAGPQGQQIMQQQAQGQPPPLGTPGQRSDMPPPQAPATGSTNANRTQPSSPQPQAPPTPSQSNKAAPKKKVKDETRKVRPPWLSHDNGTVFTDVVCSDRIRRTPLPMLRRHQKLTVHRLLLHPHPSRPYIQTHLLVLEKERWQLRPGGLPIRMPHRRRTRRFHKISSRFHRLIQCQELVSLETPISLTRPSIWTSVVWRLLMSSMTLTLTPF
jgi:hypothetical protein